MKISEIFGYRVATLCVGFLLVLTAFVFMCPNMVSGGKTNTPPVVNIVSPANNSVFNPNTPVSFNTTSYDLDGGSLAYEWRSSQVEVGVISNSANFTKILPGGTHTITLTMIDNAGALNQTNITINVKAQPVVQVLEPVGGVTKKGNVTIRWAAADPNEGTVLNISLQYSTDTGANWNDIVSGYVPNSGNYTWNTTASNITFSNKSLVKVLASDGDFVSNDASDGVFTIDNRGNNPPTAVLTVNKTLVKVGENFTLSAQSSTDTDGIITYCYFDYGDDTNSGWITSKNVSYNYTLTGVYIVSLKVRDNGSAESTNIMQIQITVTTFNNAPVLSNGTVSPTSGNNQSIFTYSVIYTDADNETPQLITVTLDDTTFSMSRNVTGSDNNYTNGEKYAYTMQTTLSKGNTHRYKFTATDGINVATGDTAEKSGPSVSTIGNNAPTLSNGSVTPTKGNATTTYIYRVNYSDQDGNASSYVHVTIDDTSYTMGEENASDIIVTNGKWYKFTSPALSTGTHKFNFSASDGIDPTSTTNVSAPTVDITPPSLTLSSAVPVNGTHINTTLLTIGGMTDLVGSTINITLNDADVGAVTVSSGAFSKQITLQSGNNTIKIIAYDDVRNNATETRVVVVDTTLPNLTVTSPQNNLRILPHTITVSGIVDKPYTTVQILLDGADISSIVGAVAVDSEGGFSKVTPQINTSSTLQIIATDLAGNTNSTTLNIIVDLTPPTPLVVSTLSSYVATPTITISGKANEVEGDTVIVNISVNGQDVGYISVATPLTTNGTFTKVVNLTLGTNVIITKATDGVGNNVSNTQTVIYDITPPALISGLQAIDAKNGKINLTWVATAATDFKEYRIYQSASNITNVSGLTPVATITNDTTNKYQVTVSTLDQYYYFAVTAVDLARNEELAVTSVSEKSKANQIPVVATIENQTALVGAEFTLQINATDADNDTLTYTDNTALFVINSTTGLIKFTPTKANIGTHTITIDVSDGVNITTATFVLSIPNRLPAITAIPDQTGVAGTMFTYQVVATDLDNDSLTYSLNITMLSINSTTGYISGIPSAAGVYSIKVTVNDTRAEDSTTFILNVSSAANHAPTITAIPAQTGTVGALFTCQVSAIDIDNDPLTYTLYTKMLSISYTGLISGTPTAVGNYTIEVTVNDGRGGIVNITFTLAVSAANNPPVITAIGAQTGTVGAQFTCQVIAADADGDALTYSASVGSITSTGTNTALFAYTPTVAGVETITITVNDTKTQTTTSFTLTVSKANTKPTITSITDQSIEAGSTFKYIANATDADNDVLLYTLNITPVLSEITINNQTGEIKGTPTKTGTYTITVTVDDGKGGTASASFKLTVKEKPSPPPAKWFLPGFEGIAMIFAMGTIVLLLRRRCL